MFPEREQHLDLSASEYELCEMQLVVIHFLEQYKTWTFQMEGCLNKFGNVSGMEGFTVKLDRRSDTSRVGLNSLSPSSRSMAIKYHHKFQFHHTWGFLQSTELQQRTGLFAVADGGRLSVWRLREDSGINSKRPEAITNFKDTEMERRD